MFPVAVHATVTSFDTPADSVTVNVASDPSSTFDAGPDMLNSALSSSLASPPVVPLRSFSVMVAELTSRPTCSVVVPEMMIVSSPSTTESSVGVMVSVPVALDVFAGIVMLASEVTV